MEWIIKIQEEVDGKLIIIPNLRILVKFEPKNEIIRFVGQLKPHNKEWVELCDATYSMEINLEQIQNVLLDVIVKMKKIIEAYKNISEGFAVIKVVEFQND
jgi:hypothetical protein